MYIDNFDEKAFFQSINEQNFGDKYKEEMQNLLRLEAKGKRSVLSVRKSACYVMAIAASLLLLVLFKMSGRTDTKVSTVKPLVALASEYNKPLQFLDHDVSRGKDAEDSSELLSKAVTFYYAKEYDRALSTFSRLQENNSCDISCQLLEAHCYSSLGKYDIAVDRFEQVLENNQSPSFNDYQYCAVFYLGINQILAGDHQAGKETLRPIADFGFKKQEIQSILKEVTIN